MHYCGREEDRCGGMANVKKRENLGLRKKREHCVYLGEVIKVARPSLLCV